MSVLLKPNIKYKINGGSIYLQPISIDDISDDYLSWLNNPQTNKYLEVRHSKQTKNTIIDYINNLRSKNGCDLLGIFYLKTNQMYGTLGIINFDANNKRIENGLLFGDKKSRRIGTGGLATILFYNYTFFHTDIIKIHNNVV